MRTREVVKTLNDIFEGLGRFLKRFDSSTNFPERAAAVEWHLGKKWHLSQKKTATGQNMAPEALSQKRIGHWAKKTATG